jgi:hypothetical protein
MSGGPAPTNALTVPGNSASSQAKKPTVPVTVSGEGEQVKTVNLEPGGYTVKYTNTSGNMTVRPVNPDGSTEMYIINAFSETGVTTYASKGPVTFQISNVLGPWTLEFVPLG